MRAIQAPHCQPVRVALAGEAWTRVPAGAHGGASCGGPAFPGQRRDFKSVGGACMTQFCLAHSSAKKNKGQTVQTPSSWANSRHNLLRRNLLTLKKQTFLLPTFRRASPHKLKAKSSLGPRTAPSVPRAGG